MATRKGNDLEISFRADYNIDPSIDILSLMEAAIGVASSSRPLEFSNRMERILKGLHMIRPTQFEECSSSSTAVDDDDQKKKVPNKSSSDPCPTRPPPQELDDDQKTNLPKKSDDLCTKKGDNEDEEKTLKLKIENSIRKFQQGFDEIRRRKRKIQVLDIKDVPRAPPMLRNRAEPVWRNKAGRVRLVH